MENIKTVIRMFRQELYILSSEQKRKSAFLFLAILVGSFSQMVGVTAILPFIEAIMDIQEFRSRPYVAYFVDLFGLRSDLSIVVLSAVLIAQVYILKCVSAMGIQFTVELQIQISERAVCKCA